MKKNINIETFSSLKKLFPENFFDLKSFSHKNLFLMEQPIWETLKLLQKYFSTITLGQIDCDISSSVFLINSNQITVGRGSIIESGAYIKGPCKIGKKCTIRHGAYIRPFTVIGNGCVVGHGSEIKHSILLDHARAPHFNYVGDSIVGNDVNLGAGVICANIRSDEKNITVKIGESYIETGMNKLGAIIGDHSRLGCNSVINPGVLLCKKTISKPCTSIQQSKVLNDAD